MKTTRAFLAAALLLGCGCAFAQGTEKEVEPIAIAEIGGAAAWGFKGGGASGSPTVAVEMTPIENWLEIEAGVTPTFNHNSTEWDTDLLFKKPWTLSKTAEFMAGVGPVWVHIRQNGVVRNELAGEAALDFMFWPSKRRRYGWYLEPSYQYAFAPGHAASVSVSGGLLISIP